VLLTTTLPRSRARTGFLPADRLLWTVLAAIAAIVPPWEHLLSVDITGMPQALGVAAAMLAFRAIYVIVRPGARIVHSLVENGAGIVAYTAILAPVSYLCARNAMPLFDHVFQRADVWMGYDWEGWAAFENSIPTLAVTLRLAYASLLPQTVLVLVISPIVGDGRRGFSFIRASLIAGIIACAGSYALPAGMPIAVTSEWYPHWAALREAAPFKISLSEVQGIITFPSFHASVAVLIAYTMRGLGGWTLLFGVVNLLMLISTTTYGLHYFSDVVAGVVVAIGSIWATALLDRSFPVDQVEYARSQNRPVSGTH